MGLRCEGEKPATVLRLVYLVGWLPALICAYLVRPGLGAPLVLSGAGADGVRAAAGLAITLLILSCGYLAALRRPPRARELLVAAGGSLIVALAMPLLFSADVYAYAYYGDLLLHGRNPYGHDPAALGDALAHAAVRAWDGRIPPRCVYGPAAVAIAAAADTAGAAAGVGGQIMLGRLAAAAAFALVVGLTMRLLREPRARAALLLNPVVIWSVAEGHNDAAMLACVLAGLCATRWRGTWFALGALVKAPALAVWGELRGSADRLLATALVLAGYAPFASAVATSSPGPSDGTAAWLSPLGLVAALTGRLPAAVAAAALLGFTAFAVRRLAPGDRIPALAFAAWFALPNAYPWYALWIVPLAARNLASIWSRALLVAALFAPVRALADALFPASELSRLAAAQPAVIVLEYLPPLLVLAVTGRARRAVAAAALVGLTAVLAVPAAAQSAAPSQVPAAAPSSPASAPPADQNAAPSPVPAAAPATPQPGTPEPPGPVPSAAAQPAPPPSPTPAASPVPAMAPSPAVSAPPVFEPATPTPNPFGYIITPTPVPVTSPDGPHILEVELNDRRIHAGGPLIVRVFTSANVVGVEARALGRFIPIPQSSAGVFALAYTMPGGIPFWLLNRNYDIVIAAATADGRQTSVSFPMLLSR